MHILHTYSILSATLVMVLFGCRQTTIIADEYFAEGETESIGTDSNTSSPLDSETHTGVDSSIDSSVSTDSDTEQYCGVPSQFSWKASSLLVAPPSFAADIKDPSPVFDGTRWHVFATVSPGVKLNMTYFNLLDWNEAGAAVQTLASTNENLADYKAAPQLFYFSPEQLWYLVYQTPQPAYSTSTDPSDVMSWSPMQQFMPVPDILAGIEEGPVDYWIICDDTHCYMFFSAFDDALYRAHTTIDAFPDGFAGTTVRIMEDEPFTLFDASNVYKIRGTDTYLLLVSAIGDIGRYFRAWTSDRLNGSWTPLAATEDKSFASINNVTGLDWTNGGILHGEMLRKNPDETMTIDTCNMQYLFSGRVQSEVDANVEYFALGLLTSTTQ